MSHAPGSYLPPLSSSEEEDEPPLHFPLPDDSDYEPPPSAAPRQEQLRQPRGSSSTATPTSAVRSSLSRKRSLPDSVRESASSSRVFNHSGRPGPSSQRGRSVSPVRSTGPSGKGKGKAKASYSAVYDEEGPAKKRKHKRVPMACVSCRSRRYRCVPSTNPDVEPRCEGCIKFRTDCFFMPVPRDQQGPARPSPTGPFPYALAPNPVQPTLPPFGSQPNPHAHLHPIARIGQGPYEGPYYDVAAAHPSSTPSRTGISGAFPGAAGPSQQQQPQQLQPAAYQTFTAAPGEVLAYSYPAGTSTATTYAPPPHPPPQSLSRHPSGSGQSGLVHPPSTSFTFVPPPSMPAQPQHQPQIQHQQQHHQQRVQMPAPDANLLRPVVAAAMPSVPVPVPVAVSPSTESNVASIAQGVDAMGISGPSSDTIASPTSGQGASSMATPSLPPSSPQRDPPATRLFGVGPSSALHFFDSVRSALLGSRPFRNEVAEAVAPDENLFFTAKAEKGSTRGPPLSGFAMRTGPRYAPPKPHKVQMPAEEMYALPPRREAEDLIDIWREQANSVLPIVHVPSFMQLFGLVYDDHLPRPPGNEKPEAEFYGIMNAVFAVGCAFDRRDDVEYPPGTAADSILMKSAQEKVAARLAKAEVFYERAKAFVWDDFVEFPTMGIMQTLLLLAQFSQATPNPSRTFALVAFATRLGISLGFHIKERVDHDCDLVELELRRRLFFISHNLTTVVAMTLGRPTGTGRSNASIGLPSAIDDEFLTPDEIIESNKPAQTGTFVQSVLLYNIVNETLLLYDINTPRTGNIVIEDLHNMMIEHKRLDDWVKGLPPHLVYGAAVEEPWMGRHQTILQHRYLNARVLLYRPFLSRMLEYLLTPGGIPHNKQQLFADFGHVSAGYCVDYAIQQIGLGYKTPTACRGAPWYHTFYIVSACSVLVAARWLNMVTPEVFERRWNEALLTLNGFEPLHLSAERSSIFLGKLYDELKQRDLTPADLPNFVQSLDQSLDGILFQQQGRGSALNNQSGSSATYNEPVGNPWPVQFDTSFLLPPQDSHMSGM